MVCLFINDDPLGAKVASTNILRVGIVCIGAKLSLIDMAALGAFGAPAVATCMTLTTLFTLRLASKIGVEPRQASLVAIGSSVCGVTAITALSPAIKAPEKETAVAVAGVVLFGTTSMMLYPYIITNVFSSAEQIGMFFGLAVHDTSQVMGAAMTFEQLTKTSDGKLINNNNNNFLWDIFIYIYFVEGVLQAAATTKLTRNLFLAAAVPALSMHIGRLTSQTLTTNQSSDQSSSNSKQSSSSSSSTKILQYIPPFVLMFIAMVIVKSLGDVYISNVKNYYYYYVVCVVF